MSDIAPLRRSTTFHVAGGVDAPANARREVVGCYEWPARRVHDEAALMLAEVVANAVLHGGVGPDDHVRIDVEVVDHTMTFTVYDRGPGFAPVAPDVPRPSGGFGLIILDRLAHRWGVAPHPDGTCVWFDLALG